MVELDTMASQEFFSKLRFDGLLPGREKGSYRIAGQVQGEAAIGTAIPEFIQELQGLDGFLKDSFTPLRIGLAGAVIGQRRDDFHTMLGEELCQVRLGREEQDRQVTPIQHMATERTSLLDKPTKVRVQFRCPTRDIDRRNIGLSESPDALLCRFSGHAFGAVRSRIDVTVPAGLIAELADIDLKDCDPGGAKRKQADSIELRLEGGVVRCPPEHLQLFRWGGERVPLSKQGQRHICVRQKGRNLLRNQSPSAHMTDRYQSRFWKPQLTAAEIQSLSLPVCQGSLDRGRDSVANLFAVPMPLDEPRVSKNTEMVGGMGLRALQFLHKIRHAFFTDKQGFQDAQPRFIAQGLENCGALMRGQHLGTQGGLHQQQLSLGEQVTASPLTCWPARLMIAK